MIVTLLTDFGTLDHYVGVMKGVILGAAPSVSVVDLAHEIPAGDVQAGAFALLAAYSYFPPGTVHIAVVDPGVGTERRALVVEAAGQRFVAPDNGVLSYLLEREPHARVIHATNFRYFRQPVSSTFHGRDVFAPVGAALARGVRCDELGQQAGDAVRLPPLAPRRGEGGMLLGRILHVDRFGNCVTSITAADLPAGSERIRARAGALETATLRRNYAGASGDEPFLVWGSTGFLELSLNGRSAAARFRIGVGDSVEVHLADQVSGRDSSAGEGGGE